MYTFIIDTNIYAGNFERQMCAFMTGMTGECGVGEHVAEQVRSTLEHGGWYSTHVVNVDDGEGCERPCQIEPTPGYFNNGMGKHYADVPENYEAARCAARDSLRDYYAPNIARLQMRLATGDYDGGWSELDCRRTIEDHLTRPEQLYDSAVRHPAYLSVGINMDSEPPQEVVKELKHRAKLFAETYTDLVISGYRLSHKVESITEEVV